jgi:hypothetical protein
MMESSSMHEEVNAAPGVASTGNPLASALNGVVSVPESVEIRMVDASTLTDYEVWFFISSILSSAFFGFLVSFVQQLGTKGSDATLLGLTTLVWLVLLAIAVLMAFSKRSRLRKKSDTIRLKASAVSRDDAA